MHSKVPFRQASHLEDDQSDSVVQRVVVGLFHQLVDVVAVVSPGAPTLQGCMRMHGMHGCMGYMGCRDAWDAWDAWDA